MPTNENLSAALVANLIAAGYTPKTPEEWIMSAIDYLHNNSSSPDGTVVPYLQASDSTDQKPGVTTPVLVTMDTTDESSGITHSAGVVTIVTAGVYFIMAAGQVGETSNFNVNVDLWMRKTDVDIPNSNTRALISATADTVVLVSQVAIRLAIGNTIKVYQSISVTGRGAGLQHSAPVGEPAIPSIIFTMYKISD